MERNREQMSPNAETSHEMDRAAPGARVRLAGANPGAFIFSSAFGPRIALAPDSGAGAGGGDGGAGAGGDGGGKAPAKVERPDYIPENFWDAEKGFKTEDFNSLVAFKAEHDANAAQVPEKPDGYKVALPKDFKIPEGVELKEGESLIDENDPRIAVAREFAHQSGMSQSDFEGLIALGAQMDLNEGAMLKEAAVKQRDLLGGKAEERINAVTSWLGAKVGGELANALAPMMFTAKSIEAFEALMRLNRGAVPGGPGSGRDSGKIELSDEDYEKMSASERINYARQASKK